MKKILCTLLAVSLLVGAVCIPVSADPAEPENDGVYDVAPEEGYTLTALPASGDTGIEAAEGNVKIGDRSDVDDFYADAVRMRLTYTPTANEQQLVLLLAEGGGSSQVKDAVTPTQDSIKYIWQETGTNGTALSFDIYPDWDNLDEGTYGVYVASSSTGLAKVASFKVYNAYKLGYVNDDEYSDVSDALAILQHYVKLNTLTGKALKAADVDKSGTVDVSDALYVLQKYVKLIDTYPVAGK